MTETARDLAPRNGLPEFRPYVYRGTGEDIYHGQIGTLEDVQRSRPAGRLAAAIAASDTAGPGPDDIGYEWYSEMAAETGDDLAEHPLPGGEEITAPVSGGPPAAARVTARPAAAGPGAAVPAADDELDVIVETADRYQAAMAAAAAPAAPVQLAPPPQRACGPLPDVRLPHHCCRAPGDVR